MADEKDLLDQNDEDIDDSGVFVLDVDEDTGDVEGLTLEALEALERQREEAPEPSEPDASSSDADEELAQEVEELRSRSLRTLADFENYRKRSEREREELRRYGVSDLLQGFLPIIDNLERAVEAGGSADDLKTGVELILRQMKDLLRQRGVEEVEAAGQPFDPSYHEAVMSEEDPTVDVPTVSAELQRGYRLHERLLRPAMVKVAMPVENDRSTEE